MKSIKVILMAVLFYCMHANADQWRYDTGTDKMTGKSSQTAVTSSDNSLNLNFPYAGSNYGSLMVRKHPQYGLDVLVYISKGQVLCTSYSGCTVKVRFGDSQPITFSATGSADHDSTTIFLQNAQKFIELAKKNTNIKVQLNIYQAGASVLEFSSPAPLVWEIPVTKKSKNKATNTTN